MQRKSIIIITALFLYAGAVKGQTSNSLGTFTPYSMFGIGEIVRQGTSFNKSMGGIGTSLRDHRYINYVNPASITARDSLAFMLDFGIESQNIYHANSNTKSAYNAFNMSHFVCTFPLYRKSAAMIGFTPYSHLGYKFEEKEQRPEFLSELGDVAYQHYGEGGINQLFLGAAMMISKNFSAGAQGIYYFGTMFRNSNVDFRTSSSIYSSIITSNNAVLKSFAGKFGLQYVGKADSRSVILAGATFLWPSNLKGDVKRLATTHLESAIDTLYQSTLYGRQMKIPAEFAVGVSFNRKFLAERDINKWMIGFDYTYQNWTNTSFAPTPGIDFSPTVKSAYKFGFELTPNYFDPRYMLKRWTYRGGVYYEQSYMKLNGQQINAMGITLGVSLPVFRLPNMTTNMINFGIDAGQRGSLKEQLVRERYMMFYISISLYDIWFKKMKYE